MHVPPWMNFRHGCLDELECRRVVHLSWDLFTVLIVILSFYLSGLLLNIRDVCYHNLFITFWCYHIFDSYYSHCYFTFKLIY